MRRDRNPSAANLVPSCVWSIERVPRVTGLDGWASSRTTDTRTDGAERAHAWGQLAVAARVMDGEGHR